MSGDAFAAMMTQTKPETAIGLEYETEDEWRDAMEILARCAGLRGERITGFWSVLGLSSVAAVFAWGPILARLRGGWGTAATLSIVTIGRPCGRQARTKSAMSSGVRHMDRNSCPSTPIDSATVICTWST